MLEGDVKAHGTKHLVGNSLTHGRISIPLKQSIMPKYVGLKVQILSEFPALSSMSKNVLSASGIKEWNALDRKTSTMPIIRNFIELLNE